MTTTRETLHRLLDTLPEDDLDLAHRYLEALGRGEVYDLEAWIDGAPLTEDEREAVDEAWEDVEAGRLIPHEEVRRRLSGGL